MQDFFTLQQELFIHVQDLIDTCVRNKIYMQE